MLWKGSGVKMFVFKRKVGCSHWGDVDWIMELSLGIIVSDVFDVHFK